MDISTIFKILILVIIVIGVYLLRSNKDNTEDKNDIIFSGLKNNKKFVNPVLEKFTINITQLAIDKKLDPVIGREKEIRRVMQILSRRKKNNVILLGHAGIGKTAIVEGLANAIVEKRVPVSLLDKVVLKIDMSAVLAGTKYRGDFEQRFKTLIDCIVAMDKKIIVFIDEIHTIIQAGGSEGSVDADDIIKPPLARGELQMIGTTTTEEYKKYIAPDTTLARRFDSFVISEPSKEQTIKILQGIKREYENYHRVIISDDIIRKIVEFSVSIKNRHFPDKAIDIMDELCAKVRLDNINNNDKIKIRQKDLDSVLKDLKKQKI
ncbi:MAG TPA: AAA family ATPase [bacterium]|jgi:ATP-dependent Clp protease ATP-binding subunit ClpC|nr:AAA family ATPase [bacterium]HOG38759.1 AAA family ATPase [bacterium]HQI03233.1 AAA family ATPase [bacterium]